MLAKVDDQKLRIEGLGGAEQRLVRATGQRRHPEFESRGVDLDSRPHVEVEGSDNLGLGGHLEQPGRILESDRSARITELRLGDQRDHRFRIRKQIDHLAANRERRLTDHRRLAFGSERCQLLLGGSPIGAGQLEETTRLRNECAGEVHFGQPSPNAESMLSRRFRGR